MIALFSLILGTFIGFFVCAMLSAGKIADQNRKIEWLKNLLKANGWALPDWIDE